MKNIVLLLLALLATVTAQSQEQLPRKPKIGLVLSGGGAKGFAHIGVLKVLEQAGVKVDYIGGTSMGAVVGGLYASGYSAHQIDSIFQATDFDALLSDYIPRSSKTFFEKRNDEMYAFTLPFKKMKVGIPTALSRGLYNYNLLNQLTSKVRHIRDFNQLPIPFLCMATDIETGEEVLINKGYLPEAMLASGAFPTLFYPVEIDGRLLVDGGVTNNFPVEEIKKLGADVIIGVDVQDDLKDRKSLKDATRILVQISNLQMIEKMKEKLKSTDIYIKPDISDYSVISFDQGQEIIKKGEEAAFAMYEKIKVYGDSTKTKNPQHLKIEPEQLKIKNISINSLKNYTRSYVIGKLRFKQNAEITYDQIKIGMDNLAATQNFSTVSYSLEKNNDRDDLIINLTENPTNTYVKFALHYDGLYKSGILLNATQKKTLFRNDVASMDLILGDNLRYNFDYYIDNGFYWSFGFRSKLNQFNRNIETDFSKDDLFGQLNIRSINTDFSSLINQAYVQTIFIQKFLIGAGVEHQYLNIKSKTLSSDEPYFDKSNYGSLFGYLKYDALDNKFFPKKGWYFFGDYQYYLFSSDYTNQFNRFSITKGDIGFAQTLFHGATLKIQSELGFAIGEESVHFFDFSLGGFGFASVNNFKPFYGYDFLSLSGDSYIKSSFTFDYEIFKKNHINFSANYANIENQLFNSSRWISRVKYSGYALGYGLESILGPVEFKYSWSPELQKGFAWVSVGFWF
ncbi:patatin [Flavobacterium sp. CYK-4]|uniref:patatin-like phospholipase family protein n=1 Tax=Flavobacterium lotistagni TaxID=2709660 RepID=UPI00140D1BFB|nr:patatin-like phospholipase family protein [Flavobacterium lotistagni]NHM06037.1 patatin [Flavobacterium lotistagni]